MLARTVKTVGLVLLASGAIGGCNKSPPTPLEPPPRWAYAGNSPMPAAVVSDAGGDAGALRTTPVDLFVAIDLHPDAHPPMPELVAHGRKPAVQACGHCHLPTGDGRPENASLAGLTSGYIVEQLSDIKSGKRKTSVPDRVPTALMNTLAQSLSDEEMTTAAKYFSSLKPHTMLQVVESDTAPRTIESSWILVKDPAGGTEPLGSRIVEVPEDFARYDERDDRTRYVAYVPKGSIARGEALVRTGGPGKTTPCLSCHGDGLRGGPGTIPPLAGRSPTYLVRQMYDFKSGARSGWSSSQMKSVVGNLSEEDMIGIAAYASSLPAGR